MNSDISFIDSKDLKKRGLVDNDGILLNRKYLEGKISYIEYKNKLAKEKGYKNNAEYQNELAKKKGYNDYSEYQNELVKRRGYKDFKEYQNEFAVKKGYKDLNEYKNEMRYENGICIPFGENKECSLYLGVYIAERILPLIFNDVERMPCGNYGYDFICNKGYKVDVKSSSLRRANNQWNFGIRKNKISDYFLMIAFDNRYNLDIMHIWLVNNNEVIRCKKLNSIMNLTITNDERYLEGFKKYEITDKLGDIQKMCDEFKKISKE